MPVTICRCAVFEDIPETAISGWRYWLRTRALKAGIRRDGPSMTGRQYQQPPGICNDAGGCKQGRLWSSSLACSEKKYNTSNKQTTRSHFLQPLSNVHFDERFSNNGDHHHHAPFVVHAGLCISAGDPDGLYQLCESFHGPMVTRSKEIGIRKVMGSSRTQLRVQVLFETGLLVWRQRVSPSGWPILFCPT